MALGLQPPPPENWERWPQHHPTSADYHMMDTGLLPYEARPVTTAPLQRPVLAPHFVPGASYNLSSMMTPVASAPYQAAVSYSGYVSYSPASALDASFKSQQCLDRPQPPGMHDESRLHNPQDGWLSDDRSPSPSIKSEAQMSTSARSINSDTSTTTVSTGSKTIVPNVRVNGAPVHEFHTPVDKLMRAIQGLMGGDKSSTDQAEASDSQQTAQGKQAKPRRRRFCCDIPGCTKTFAQKNNLDTHRRAHTGECPYICKFCGEGFTQGVNFKSHIHRHMGKKPYKCPQCGKAFPQKGNVTQHMKTHDRSEIWVCKLNNCGKTFTTRGNLKPHQNKFHQDTIDAFFAKFATVTDVSELSEEDKEMAKYLCDLYPHANKGIKGRGKGRKVKRLVLPCPQPELGPAADSASSNAAHAPYPMPLPHALPLMQMQTPQPTHHPHSFPGLSNPAAYSITRSNMVGVGARGPHAGYGMMTSEETSVVANGQVSPSSLALYEEDHGRELAFGDRMY